MADVRQKWMRWAISIGAAVVAIAHLLWPGVAIDGVTATLLLVVLLPWLQPLFKSLELPGGVKVEFQELESVARRAEAAGLLAAPSSPEQAPKYSFLQVATTDPNLALAGLRIELERRLEHLARSRGANDAPSGIGNLLRYLNLRQLIGGAERAVLSDLVALLNAAVHGATVDSQAAEWALEIGPRILQALEERASSKDFRYQGIVPGESN
jgi:hypothetical protein